MYPRGGLYPRGDLLPPRFYTATVTPWWTPTGPGPVSRRLAAPICPSPFGRRLNLPR